MQGEGHRAGTTGSLTPLGPRAGSASACQSPWSYSWHRQAALHAPARVSCHCHPQHALERWEVMMPTPVPLEGDYETVFHLHPSDLLRISWMGSGDRRGRVLSVCCLVVWCQKALGLKASQASRPLSSFGCGSKRQTPNQKGSHIT